VPNLVVLAKDNPTGFGLKDNEKFIKYLGKENPSPILFFESNCN
jgi:hypothetical protein